VKRAATVSHGSTPRKARRILYVTVT
jgi:hypothetical protein